MAVKLSELRRELSATEIEANKVTKGIAYRVKTTRKKLGLTQIEVAKMAGISTPTFANIEKANANYTIATLVTVCRVLKITRIFEPPDPTKNERLMKKALGTAYSREPNEFDEIYTEEFNPDKHRK